MSHNNESTMTPFERELIDRARKKINRFYYNRLAVLYKLVDSDEAKEEIQALESDLYDECVTTNF